MTAEPRARELTYNTPDGDGGTALFMYDPDMPYQVTIVFDTDDGPRNWVLDRWMLADGVNAITGDPIGDGDIKVWSTKRQLHMFLSSPGGCGYLEFSRGRVRQFLLDTIEQVPLGREVQPVPDVLPAWLLDRYAS